MLIGTEGDSLGIRAAPLTPITKDLYLKYIYIYLNYLIVSDLKVTLCKCWTSKASKPNHERLQFFAQKGQKKKKSNK